MRMRPGCPRHAIRALVVALSLLAGAATADVVHLRNGKTLRGEVIKEDDDFVVVRVPFGEVKLKASDVESIDRQSPVEYRLDLGRQMLQEKQFDRAIRVFEEAYVSNKQAVEAQRVLANAYYTASKHYRKLNRNREAREALEKLIKLDPSAQLVQHTAAADLDEIKKNEKVDTEKIAQARTFAEAKEWPQAIAAFEQVMSNAPDTRPTISPDLAQCYIGRAVDSAQAKRIMEATQDLETALKLDPTLADKLEKFYTTCALPAVLNNLDHGDLTVAQTDLRRVLAFAPTNRNVLYVAGRLCESLNQIPQAAEYYAHALRIRVGNPTPEFLADLRKKLEADLDIRPDMWKVDTSVAEVSGFSKATDGPAEKLETENFTILHYNKNLADRVAEAAEYHRARIIAELGFAGAWKGKTKIYIHRTQTEYTLRTGQPEWTGGCSKYVSEGSHVTQLEIHSWQTSPRLLKSVLPHEITHCIVYANLPDPGNLPRSLHEGFAVLMEPPFRQDYFLDFLRSRLKTQDFIPLPDLISARDYPKDPEFFYAEGFAIVDYLTKSKGLNLTTSLIKDATSSGYASAELLKLSGARSLDELEAEWKTWIMKPAEVRPVVEKLAK
jgi:tetratricopeptide (TPR) repeat protein